MNTDPTTRTKVNKIADKCGRMIVEWRAWKGERPESLRIRMKDYLILREAGITHIQGIEVKPG